MSESDTLQVIQKKQKSLIEKFKFWNTLLPSMTFIPWVIYRHYTKGPAAHSWSLSEDLAVNFMRETLYRANNITAEDFQDLTNINAPVSFETIEIVPFTVPNSYRQRAANVLSNTFSPLESEQIGWDWELDRHQAEIQGEWMQEKNPQNSGNKTLLYFHGGAYYAACYETYRPLLSEFIQSSKGRTCAVNYRLAPQDPFPAGLVDALATYIYLLEPPPGSFSSAVDPSKVVIAGDSAGGGLTLCLLLAIRNSQLPLPAGGITISGWLDLTHSLPSFKEKILTDFIPPLGFKHIPSPALEFDKLPKNPKEQQDHDSLDTFGDDYGRYQLYAPNKALRIPTVSPVFDKKHLRGLPRLLMQCGQAERLYDENIYAALLATNYYGESNETPTQVRLETYADQPHVFQILFKNKLVTYAKESMARFFREVTEQQEEERLNEGPYLEAYNIQPDGNVVDINKSLLNEMTKEKLDEWTDMLNKPSLKERVERLKAVYQLKLQE